MGTLNCSHRAGTARQGVLPIIPQPHRIIRLQNRAEWHTAAPIVQCQAATRHTVIDSDTEFRSALQINAGDAFYAMGIY